MTKTPYSTETPQQKCGVIHVFMKHNMDDKEVADDKLIEAVSLCEAIKLDCIYSDTIPLDKVTPATLIGSGNVEHIAQIIEDNEIDLIVVNHTLSPIQQRNLEKELKAKVIDRTGLILEIFGERASTKEGTLQVELAALSYQRSRLVRSWTHLERQRGGFGFTGGPGESQIEIDRRLIDERITKIKKDLEKVVQTREQNRKKRKNTPFPIVALVGYTNAGKSTLFNLLTGANVFAKDLLFATLDPTMRKIELPNTNDEIILSDTVGFISDLPTQLVAAFRATLEEVLEADIILHVRDISDPACDQHKKDVLKILDDIGVDLDEANIVELLNKSDLLSKEDFIEWQRYARFELSNPAFLVSALKEDGINLVLEEIEHILNIDKRPYTVKIDIKDGHMISWLKANTQIEDEQFIAEQEKYELKLIANKTSIKRFEKEFGREISK